LSATAAPSGASLRLLRLDARIPERVVAARMGVSRSRLRWIEISPSPLPPETRTRYMAALSAIVRERDAQP
jgi:transcriptional regulator with XRE-family HTH domain